MFFTGLLKISIIRHTVDPGPNLYRKMSCGGGGKKSKCGVLPSSQHPTKSQCCGQPLIKIFGVVFFFNPSSKVVVPKSLGFTNF